MAQGCLVFAKVAAQDIDAGISMSQPGIKCWLSKSSRIITTVEPGSSLNFTEGRFLTKDDLIALSVMVAAEIYAKQQAERPDLQPKSTFDKLMEDPTRKARFDESYVEFLEKEEALDKPKIITEA